MTGTPPRVLTKRMGRPIEPTLMPECCISHHADRSFVEELGIVERQLAGLVATDPAQAVWLYATFLVGRLRKIGEIDGSSGGFGWFVDSCQQCWSNGRTLGPRPQLSRDGLSNGIKERIC